MLSPSMVGHRRRESPERRALASPGRSVPPVADNARTPTGDNPPPAIMPDRLALSPALITGLAITPGPLWTPS